MRLLSRRSAAATRPKAVWPNYARSVWRLLAIPRHTLGVTPGLEEAELEVIGFLPGRNWIEMEKLLRKIQMYINYPLWRIPEKCDLGLSLVVTAVFAGW